MRPLPVTQSRETPHSPRDLITRGTSRPVPPSFLSPRLLLLALALLRQSHGAARDVDSQPTAAEPAHLLLLLALLPSLRSLTFLGRDLRG